MKNEEEVTCQRCGHASTRMRASDGLCPNSDCNCVHGTAQMTDDPIRSMAEHLCALGAGSDILCTSGSWFNAMTEASQESKVAEWLVEIGVRDLAEQVARLTMERDDARAEADHASGDLRQCRDGSAELLQTVRRIMSERDALESRVSDLQSSLVVEKWRSRARSSPPGGADE